MTVVATPEEIASWPPPNYASPETRRPLVLGVEIPLVILMVLFVSMRFYSRTMIIRALGADDWFILAAAITAVATSTLMCISTQSEFQTGYHIWDLRPDIAANPVQSVQMAMAIQLLFVPITCFTKVSVLLTYLRIFPSGTNKWFCYILISFTSVWAVASFFFALFQCKPVQSYWLIAQYPDRDCVDAAPLYYVTGGLNTCSDFLIFLWPAKDLARIRIPLKEKVILIAMFTLGIIICVAGVCRIWYTFVTINSYDGFWNGATLYAIVAIETSIGIVCGCLPACKPLMSKVFPNIFASTYSSTHRSTPKKTLKMGDQPFPFQFPSGGIVKAEGYSVEYDAAGSRQHIQRATTISVIVSRPKEDEDAINVESEEWITMQDDPDPKDKNDV